MRGDVDNGASSLPDIYFNRFKLLLCGCSYSLILIKIEYYLKHYLKFCPTESANFGSIA